MLKRISMNAGNYRRAILFFGLALFLALVAGEARADLSASQARKAMTRMAGFELTNSAVRVRRVTSTGPSSAEATADIKAVFKFEQGQNGRWHVAEVRTRPNQWEEIYLIAGAAKARSGEDNCNAPDPPFKGRAAVDPSVKRARCLLGSLLGVETPSDAVRINDVSPMAVPLASQNSAVVVAWVRVDARLANDKQGWRVVELKAGDGPWVAVDPLVASVTEEKKKKALMELQKIADALERFRRDRGYYVVSDNHGVAIDYLSPRYLNRVIRLDPWHQPYKYQGERDRFTLSSAGPDGKNDTADDLKLSGQAR